MINIVYATVYYRSGTCRAKLYANSSYKPGDVADVRVRSGYITTCRIIDILEEDVEYTNSYGVVICNTKKEEEETMQTIIMPGTHVVMIKNHCSERASYCFTEINFALITKEEMTVVYESDNGWHVGTVEQYFDDPNDCPSVNSVKYWVVNGVFTQPYRDRLSREKEVQKLQAKLQAKKKQYQDFELLRLIAANDPETAELLQQYAMLTSSIIPTGDTNGQ